MADAEVGSQKLTYPTIRKKEIIFSKVPAGRGYSSQHILYQIVPSVKDNVVPPTFFNDVAIEKLMSLWKLAETIDPKHWHGHMSTTFLSIMCIYIYIIYVWIYMHKLYSFYLIILIANTICVYIYSCVRYIWVCLKMMDSLQPLGWANCIFLLASSNLM